MTLKEEYSVAAVVFYNNEYLLLKYGLGHWEFVKGHQEKGETDKQTIMRELEEETGIKDAVILDGFKEKYEYTFNFRDQRIHKTVSCYLIKSGTKHVRISFEHDDFVWLPYQKALKRLSFTNARRLVEKAEIFRNSPLSSFL